MKEERDWTKEEKALTAIYIRRGYLKEVAEDMAQREIEKRKIECGYPVKSVIAGDLLEAVEAEVERQEEEVSKKVDSKLVKSQKKGAKK